MSMKQVTGGGARAVGKGWCAVLALVLVTSCAGGAAQNAPLGASAEDRRVASTPPPPEKRVRAQGTPASFADPERVAKIVAALEQQRGTLEEELKALGAPGFAWGLVVDDRLAASGAGGTTRVDGGAPVTPATVFRIGSITKVFTALALLRLADQGALSLDAPLREVLPEADGVVYPTADSPLITLRHLLTHRSGLPRLGRFDYTNPDAPPTERDVLGALEGVELTSVPGTAYDYSNFGFGVLGLVVSRAAAQPFDAYLSEHVLAPLGMSHSAWSASAVPEELLARPHAAGPDGALGVVREWPKGAGDGAGGIYSSVEDMARFAAFQLSALPASSAVESPVLARSALREAQRLHAVRRLRLLEQEPVTASVSGEGLGWAVYRNCRFEQVVWHNGGTEGHRAALYLLPTRGVGVVILANRDGVDLDGPAINLLNRLHDADVLPERVSPPAVSDVWRERADATLALGQRFDPATFEQLFDARTRQALPAQVMQPLLERQYANFGACRVARPLPTRDRIWQAATLECERGTPPVIEVALSPGQQVLGLWLGSPEAQAERARGRSGGAGEPEPSCAR